MSPRGQPVDYTVFDGKLRHPLAAFTPAEVEARAAQIGQPSATARIETFAWLLEVAAQLGDELGPAFALRGGTNVQLRLEPGLQRASQDIDAVFRGTVDELQAAIDRLNERFVDCDGFLRFERVRRDFPPEDFAAWSCPVPAMQGGQIYDGLPRRLLTVEVTLIREGLPTEPLGGEVFGLAFAGSGVGLTCGALVGDKLLTLGANTTGIHDANDRLARQFYDLDNLTTGQISSAALEDAAAVATYFAPIEGRYRSLEVDAESALLDSSARAAEWGQISLPSGPGREVVQEIRAWQGANVPVTMHLGPAGWAMRALRVGLVAESVRRALTDVADGVSHLDRARELVASASPAQRSIAEALRATIGNGANALNGGDPERPALLALALLGIDELEELVVSSRGSGLAVSGGPDRG